MADEQRNCECGMPQRWIADAHFPVEFDEEMNEYQLVRDGARSPMRYCFWCGGRLPESKRGTFFTTPDKAERDEVASLLKGAKSHEDVVQMLGPPDQILDMGGAEKDTKTGKLLARWEQHYEYTTRWKSLVVYVPVILQGRFTYSIHGHYLPDKRAARRLGSNCDNPAGSH
jgi:hypothetical protein